MILPKRSKRHHAVLLVEDSASDVDCLRRAFADYPINLEVRGTAEEALAHLSLFPAKYTLALIDVSLPGMGGEGLVRAVRADKRHSHLITVALSARRDKETVRRLYEAGVNSYLSKGEGFPDKIAYFVHHYWLTITQLPPRGSK